MRGARLSLIALAAFMALPGPVQAEPAIAEGRVSATIVEPLRAVPLEDLTFGTLSVGREAGGEVRVSAATSQAAYSGTAAPACAAATQCAPHAARFAVSGEADRAYRVEMPTDVFARGELTGQVLKVSALEIRSRNQPAANWRGTLDPSGKDEFAIGGTLTIPAATKADSFRADLAIAVFYD